MIEDVMTETRHTITERWLDGLHGAVRYWHSAPQQRLPVLLIHGYGAMIEHWQAVMRPIARQHTMLALDLHNFGQSAIVKQPSRQLWAEQCAELISAACHGPAVVVGHSMGGSVAAQLAQSYPQLVRGLVLVDSTGLNDPTNQPSTLDNAIFSLARAPGVGELLAGLAANKQGARQGLLAAYYRKEKVTPELVEQFSRPLRRPGGPAAYLAATRAFPDLFLDAKPGDISCPALLIWGEHDRSVPPALAAYFKRTLLPQAEIAIIPASGHCPFDETPQPFCDILLPWLSRV
jgi:pimeloyl-ACP methyl ester carboxylesterase